jgi:aspartokinase/homoserine dehydrogenase 1
MGADEMANFGAEWLHTKTIIPFVRKKNIPLRILDTFNPQKTMELANIKF